jgi:hypothetical protein
VYITAAVREEAEWWIRTIIQFLPNGAGAAAAGVSD